MYDRWRLLAWASTLGVILMCFLPSENVPDTGASGMDKVFHALAFFAVGYSWRRTGLAAGRVLALGIALALGTELGQALLSRDRSGDWLDAGADIAGVVLGLIVHARVHRAPEPR